MNYTVQQGDTIASIAARFNIPILSILTANRMTDPRAILPGMDLYIPLPRPHATGHTPPSAPHVPAPHELLQRIEQLEGEVNRLHAELNQLETRVDRLETP